MSDPLLGHAGDTFDQPFYPVPACPPGGMAGLVRCYDDLNNASAFIAQLMIDQINNNPAAETA